MSELLSSSDWQVCAPRAPSSRCFHQHSLFFLNCTWYRHTRCCCSRVICLSFRQLTITLTFGTRYDLRGKCSYDDLPFPPTNRFSDRYHGISFFSQNVSTAENCLVEWRKIAPPVHTARCYAVFRFLRDATARWFLANCSRHANPLPISPRAYNPKASLSVEQTSEKKHRVRFNPRRACTTSRRVAESQGKEESKAANIERLL